MLCLLQDFQYNLQLLEGRDNELDQYESALEDSRGALVEKERQISELHAKLADTSSEQEKHMQVSVEQKWGQWNALSCATYKHAHA